MTRASCRRADMLSELLNDNKKTIATMRKAHKLCDKHEDVATASLPRKLHRRRRKARLVPVRGQASLRPSAIWMTTRDNFYLASG